MVLLSRRREEWGKVGLRYGPTKPSPTLLYEDLVEPYLNPTLPYSSLRRLGRTIS